MSERQVDAILSPLGFAGTGDASSRLRRLHDAFASLLGAKRIFVRHQGDAHFITGDPGETLLTTSADLPEGRPRYHWTDRGDGVSLGRRNDYA